MSIRKTVEIDDDLILEIRKIQKEEGKTFKRIANRFLRIGIELSENEELIELQNKQIEGTGF